MKFNDPKLKNEIFLRVDMKHSYFSNYLFAINFSVVVCQKLIHVYAFMFLLTLSAHTREGYSSHFVCHSVCHFLILEKAPFSGLKLTSVHSR